MSMTTVRSAHELSFFADLSYQPAETGLRARRSRIEQANKRNRRSSARRRNQSGVFVDKGLNLRRVGVDGSCAWRHQVALVGGIVLFRGFTTPDGRRGERRN